MQPQSHNIDYVILNGKRDLTGCALQGDSHVSILFNSQSNIDFFFF